MRSFIFAVVGLLASGSAIAQPIDASEMWRERFSGFRGIVFGCTTSPDGDFEASLCRAIEADARFLAASSRTAFLVAKDSFEQTVVATLNKYLNLNVEIVASGDQYFYATYVGISAESYYSAAIGANAPDGTIEAMPRSGTLVFWDRRMAASGNKGGEFKSTVVSAVSEVLRTFYADYLTAQQQERP